MRFVEHLKKSPEFSRQIVHHEWITPRQARYGRLEKPLPPALEDVLDRMGVNQLYSHQAEAINFIRRGRHTLTATPTASGKTLIYNLPVLESVLAEPLSRALYVFPLKALEQDQLKALDQINELIGPVKARAAVYDGDTSPYHRKKLRDKPPHVLITNPDMIHLSMLAYHDSWAEFWTNLRFVVIDEIHYYRGVLGSHMAQIIRRLRRVLDYYRAAPTFILSSATIGNPRDFAEALTSLSVETVIESGAPAAGKHFVFLNPDDSAAFFASQLFVQAIKQQLRTIAFTQSRRLTELMHMWAMQLAPALAGRLSSYRAGFLPSERREIEKKLNTGELLGVISTSALELGLDIGELEVCLLVGYPGSLVKTFQRSGRVGRSDFESVVLLLAQPDALDQYFMRHPGELFKRGYEPAVLDPDNEPITLAHLPCAAAELPLSSGDPFFQPHNKPGLMSRAVKERRLLLSAEGDCYYPARPRPHQSVNIRTAGEGYVILDENTGQVIGGIDAHRAFKECHPGAIYPHRAETWGVTGLDLKKKNVLARKIKVNYYTRPKTEKETEILEVMAVKPVANFLAKFGRLRVRERVTGYEKRLIRGQELMGTYDLELPETVFETEGLWFEMEDFIQNSLEPGQHYMGGIHAIEHAAIGLFPLVALCDRDDLGGISYTLHPEIKKGAVFIYDGVAGGAGLAQRGFETLEELLSRTCDTVAECPCETGCPSCIHSPKCGSGNKPLDKAAAIRILETLLGRRSVPAADQQTEPEFEVPAKNADPARNSQPRILVFDLETRRSAAEVGGWSKAHLMGLAAGVVYDINEDRYSIYEEKQASALVEQLAGADLIVGFNQLRFDYEVLKAYTPLALGARPNLDLLEEVFKVLGRRVSLGHLGQATLNRAKTADGLQSLEWVRQGRLDLVKVYCQEDVRLTYDLFAFAEKNGYLVFEDKNGRRARIPLEIHPEKLMTGGKKL